MADHCWKHVGGCNAGCSDDCWCSAPVYECTSCGACDHGDNDETRDIIRKCRNQRTGAPECEDPGTQAVDIEGELWVSSFDPKLGCRRQLPQ